jgi:hypothetical protein
MSDKIEIILEKCLARLKAGEKVEDCLRQFPDRRAELEPLLLAAAGLYSIPEISVSDDFRRESHDRLMARIRNESQSEASRRFRLPQLNFRVLVPAAMVALLALLFWLVSPGVIPAPVTANINPGKFSLSILSGHVETRAADENVWQNAENTTELITGTQVRTSADAHAVITFFDGSTAALDPGTEVEVAESSFVNALSAHIVLNQYSGETWNNVIGTGTEQPYYAVQTPLVTLVAQGTSFSSQVGAAGATNLAVSEGTVTVIDKQNTQVNVGKDQQINIVTNLTAAASPVNISAPKNELSLSLSPAGVSSVCDPNGASTGYLPNGISFNQIPNSTVALSANGQIIQIEQPVPGEYTITIRSTVQEDMVLAIRLIQNDQSVYQQNLALPSVTANDWTVHLNLTNPAGITESNNIVSVEPLTGTSPESVVQMPLAIQRATALTAATATPNTGAAATGSTKTTATTKTAPAVSAATSTTQPSSGNTVPPAAITKITTTTGTITTTIKPPAVTVPPVAVTPTSTTTAPPAVTPPVVKTTTTTPSGAASNSIK